MGPTLCLVVEVYMRLESYANDFAHIRTFANQVLDNLPNCFCSDVSYISLLERALGVKRLLKTCITYCLV